MVKTYQLTRDGPFGTSLKVAPITTDEVQNKETCLQVNGTSENKIAVQAILPDVHDFVLAGNFILKIFWIFFYQSIVVYWILGTEQVFGFKCDKFTFEETIGQKKNSYVLWVRYKKSPKYPASRMPIPVRYEMRGFNTLLGSHYDHYYLEYDYYSHEDIPVDVFEVNIGKVYLWFV